MSLYKQSNRKGFFTVVSIAPSILSADFANLQSDVKKLEQSGADILHLDIMDGNCVPNLTFGPSIVKALRPYSKLPFDVHLMVNNPDEMIFYSLPDCL